MSSTFAKVLIGVFVFAGACLAQSPSALVILSGTTLATGYSIGLNSSGNRTDWLATEGSSDFIMRYPAGQSWGGVWITYGPSVATNRPGADLSAFQTLAIELCGDPGTTIDVGIKDSTQLDDGTEAKTRVTLSADWQTYTIPLSNFTGVKLSKVYMPVEFVFSGALSQTARVRSVVYTTASATGVKVLPQFAFGGGWYSAVYFSNPGAAAVSFPVAFYGDDGTPLTISSVGAPSKTYTLAPGATVVIEAPNVGPLVQGYVSAVLQPEVIGYGVFRWSNPGYPDQEAVVPLSGNQTTLSSLIWDDTKYATAIAILNPGSVTATIAVTVRNASGKVIGTPLISLAPGNKQTFMLRDLQGLSQVSGSLGSADFVATTGAVAVLGLRANGSAITSIPTSDR